MSIRHSNVFILTTSFACDMADNTQHVGEGNNADSASEETETEEYNAYILPYTICDEELELDANHPAGQIEVYDREPEPFIESQTCFINHVNGAVPEGFHFGEYGECDDVKTQRPYWYAPPATESDDNDPRLSDPEFMEELRWTKTQLEATGCICCHSSDVTQMVGAFDVEYEPIWLDSMGDRGLAVMAGIIDTSVFGVYPAQENNGFSRDGVGAPTTDVTRFQTFFEQELERRDVSSEEIEAMDESGQWLWDNLVDEPRACVREFEGVDRDGRISWSGQPIRYIYVMEADTPNPGQPPADLPKGVIWRLQADPSGPPFQAEDNAFFGVVPPGASQGFPSNETPPEPLIAGETYRLILLGDMGETLHTNCTFDY